MGNGAGKITSNVTYSVDLEWDILILMRVGLAAIYALYSNQVNSDNIDN